MSDADGMALSQRSPAGSSGIDRHATWSAKGSSATNGPPDRCRRN
jgi:hypothetical protein